MDGGAAAGLRSCLKHGDRSTLNLTNERIGNIFSNEGSELQQMIPTDLLDVHKLVKLVPRYTYSLIPTYLTL